MCLLMRVWPWGVGQQGTGELPTWPTPFSPFSPVSRPPFCFWGVEMPICSRRYASDPHSSTQPTQYCPSMPCQPQAGRQWATVKPYRRIHPSRPMSRAVASVNCQLNHHLLSATRPSLSLLDPAASERPGSSPTAKPPVCSLAANANANAGLPCTVDAISVRDIGDTATTLASVACRHRQPITRPSPKADSACFRIALIRASPSLHLSIYLLYTLYLHTLSSTMLR
ncbi:hypothetical protein COCMIDRAFT_25804 [Bipolaris oryzae ATCC 44560]|uniref:Uncharacterized protein n=1 Tax=Bipolaris oryzae ATCC 44560 TaxID=930090 RepID=W6Z319_COCMI|nr:uncharacterized protein COCMIDRAFT_25804 [Bipolaris oryzae ATCC 44560]EUC46142.1 hypothetical protein COCMIDRAFT_25804 [Bipolaris oryzae ATCC 44560]